MNAKASTVLTGIVEATITRVEEDGILTQERGFFPWPEGERKCHVKLRAGQRVSIRYRQQDGPYEGRWIEDVEGLFEPCQ
ncbi:MAG: hypothetical protein LC772_00410 [Chloroflexi bacterium]|nr:hypothetical protein [Chloroflexota bacterium]